MKKILGIYLFFTCSVNAIAQNKYWIFFRDKDSNSKAQISEKCKNNRRLLNIPIKQFSDFPIRQDYISKIQSLDIQVINQSKWLNGVSAVLTKKQIQEIKNFPFVQNIQLIDERLFITKTRVQTTKDKNWRTDFVMQQVGLTNFLKSNLTGKGITIGVIDAGFYLANSNEFLTHVFKQNKIRGIHDYVNPAKTNHFEDSESYSDFHGTEVLSAITGVDSLQKIQVGMATDAQFYLARTDSGKREFRGEEDNWVAAMEWLDSLGVRIINTSLGYTKGFTNPKENYTPNQMDGKTSVISKAAKIAAEEKGILVIVSAGNEGDARDWKIISTPADAEGVLSIGATNEDGLKIGYSSIGPEFLSYTKPNVACYSLSGTSLSAPVITGFAACLMQAKPELTNKELIELIEKSSNLYPFCNNFIGFGIPSAEKALKIIKNEAIKENQLIEVSEGQSKINLVVSEDDAEEQTLVTMFYKKDATHVLKQESYHTKYKFIVINRNPAYPRMTISAKNFTYELVWK